MQSPLSVRTAVNSVREKLPLLYFKALYWQMRSSPQTRCMKRQTIFILNQMQFNVAKYYMLSTNIQYTDFNGDGKKKPNTTPYILLTEFLVTVNWASVCHH